MHVLPTAGCWGDGKTMSSVSICMYMNVYVCIWTVYDSMTVNSAAQVRETEVQWTVRLQVTRRHIFFGQKTCLMLMAQKPPFL